MTNKLDQYRKKAKNKVFTVSASIGKERFDFIKDHGLSVTIILKKAIDELAKRENEDQVICENYEKILNLNKKD